MAKKPVKAKSKAVVGRAKKKWSISLTRRSALFGLVGLMAFSILGGYGYQQWQEHQLEAQAAGYTRLMTSPVTTGVYINACKKFNTINRNYSVKLKFVAITDIGDFAYRVSRNGVQTTVINETPYGSTTYKTLYTLKGTDKVMGVVQTNNGAWFNVGTLTNC